jgi:cytoplasmic FMR1 interacting protein
MTTKVTLEEAVNTVETLDEISLPDYQPCIEAMNSSILYKVNLDTNFEDKTAYVTGISKYIEEAAMHAQLVGWVIPICCPANIFLTIKSSFSHH